MGGLVFRKIPVVIRGSCFVWSKNNILVSMMMNPVTFQAIGFERYIRGAMQDAKTLIADPAALRKARLFDARQSVSHSKYLKAPVGRYPGVQELFAESVVGIDKIYEAEDLHGHVAYAPNIEATRTPLFGTIEHRGPALIVYAEVGKNKLYRTRTLKQVFGHTAASAGRITQGFQKRMPDIPESADKDGMRAMPLASHARMPPAIRASQALWHHPSHGRILNSSRTWRNHYGSGEDTSVDDLSGMRLAA